MRINTFFYAFNQGIRSIFKNKWYSLASVETIGSCLFLFGRCYLLQLGGGGSRSLGFPLSSCCHHPDGEI